MIWSANINVSFLVSTLGSEDVKDKENALFLNICYNWGTLVSYLEFSSFKPMKSKWVTEVFLLDYVQKL